MKTITRGKIPFAIIPTKSNIEVVLPKLEQKYEILGKLSKLSEVECRELVELCKDEEGYCNYEYMEDWGGFLSAKESLKSLLKSENIYIKDWLNFVHSGKYEAIDESWNQYIKDKEKLPEDYIILKLL